MVPKKGLEQAEACYGYECFKQVFEATKVQNVKGPSDMIDFKGGILDGLP